jgi:Lipocalin-like domain
MNRAIFALLAGAIVFWTGSSPSMSAEKSSAIVGTWRVTSYSILTLSTNEVAYPVGENPIGYIQYSPGGHVVVFISTGNPKQPASSIYTEADRAELHKGIFGAYAGTYSVEGNKVIHHVVAAWRPDWIGGDQIRYFEINGNKLTIKGAPVIFTQTGKEIVGTTTFERIE